MKTHKFKLFSYAKNVPDLVNTTWQTDDIELKPANFNWQRDFLFGVAVHFWSRATKAEKLRAIERGALHAGKDVPIE